MRKRDTYWSLFHTPEKRQINDLRTDHVEAIFEAIPKKDQKDWVIWREGFRTWKPLTDFPQLIQSLRHASATTPDAHKPPAPPGGSSSSNDATRVAMDSNPSIGIPRAKFEAPAETIAFEFADDNVLDERDTRFPKKWEVRVHAGEKTYVAHTIDVSLHGMYLKEMLPLDLPDYVNVEIRTPHNTFGVICTPVRSQVEKGISRLKIEVNEQMHAYHAAVLQK